MHARTYVPRALSQLPWRRSALANVPLERIEPLWTLAGLFVICLIGLSLSRGLLVAFNAQRVLDEHDLWRVFIVGLRMDVIAVAQLFAIPATICCLLPGDKWRLRITVALLATVAAVLIFMELSTPSFLTEYDRRPDRIFYEYLRYPREVFSTLVKSYWWQLPLVGLLTGLGAAAFASYGRSALSANTRRPWVARALVFPLCAALLFVGWRSSFGHRPANASTAAFSANHLVNELALNSTYSLITAIYMGRHEVDARSMYPSMATTDVLNRVRRYMDTDLKFTSPELPTLHKHTPMPTQSHARPPNVVVFVLESLGAEFVGSLGGLPLTPNLDRLSSEGLWFTDLYATGTRTVRGLEAIVTGFPPTAAQSVLKLPASQSDFYTLAGLLRHHGYATEFVYGGVANFDNMGAFFRTNGFDRVIEQRHFEHAVMAGSWGVSDEDLVAKAHESFVEYGDRPFFAVMLSTSNHVPFEYPAGRIDLYEQPAATRNNAVKYTDYAIGKLMELARRAKYFENTVFLIVADHDARVYGADLVPIAHFRIPGLIIGPGVPRRHETRVASQIDLAPTLLGLLGIDAEDPMIGRDLLNREDVAGRAIMQYGEATGFRVGNKVAIVRPNMAPQTFLYDNRRLVAAPADEELQRDAVAHLLWADEAYRQRIYRLPFASGH